MDTDKSELLENQIIIGERNYAMAINEVIARAERELLIFDHDLTRGDYSSLHRYELLRQFLAKGSYVSLKIILHDADSILKFCPRLVELLQTYGHLMTVYQTTEYARVATDAFVIVDQQHYLRRFHINHARFRYAFNDMETASALNLRFEELLEATSHTISASGLGV